MEVGSVNPLYPGKPQAANAPVPRTEESDLPPRDEALVRSLGLKPRNRMRPVQEPAPDRIQAAIGNLTQLGVGTVPDLAERIRKSFSQGYEALVRLNVPHTVIASFRDEQDLENYAGLRQGKPCDDPTVQAGHATLLGLEQKGIAYFFPRETGPLGGRLPLEGPTAWLRTDAAGAALLLARGQSIRVISPDGAERSLHSLEQAGKLALDVPEDRQKLAGLVDGLEGAGFKVHGEHPLPADVLASDQGEQFWRDMRDYVTGGFEEQTRKSDALTRKKVLDDLASGETIDVTVPGTFRQMILNRTQAETLLRVARGQEPAVRDYADAYNEVLGLGGKIFARQMYGDAKGQLVLCQNFVAGYLNLVQGADVVVLDREGDLKTVTSLADFQALAYRAQNAPGLEQALQAYGQIRKAGYEFWVEKDGRVQAGGFPEVLEGMDQGRRVVIQGANGIPSVQITRPDHLTSFLEKAGLKAAEAPSAIGPGQVDPATPKPNLMLVYYGSLHSPYTPIGAIDDFLLKLKQNGSNEHGDLVFFGSDMPQKEAVRHDYVQPGELQPLSRPSAPSTLMADPKVLENFLYSSIKRHPANEKIRLMVVGHGNADLGLMDDAAPDGTMHRMSVAAFAGAIKKALDRVEQETGNRPVIDNLIMGSCLMGNSGFLQAVAETGDVKALSASPELMLDTFPAEALTRAMTADRARTDGPDYARELVDVFRQAEAFPGGPANRRNALIYGAYDLDPQKARSFKSALKEFFETCLRHPESARFLREDIADCPVYNLHPVGGGGPGENHRDIVQVARRIQGDARIGKDIKEAARKLEEANRAQVLLQKGEADYQGREGTSLFLPLSRGAYDPYSTKPPSPLLEETGFQPFIKMLQESAPRRQAIDVALNAAYRRQAEAALEGYLNATPHDPAETLKFEQGVVDALQQPLPPSSTGGRVRQAAVTALRTAASLVGGAVGLTVGVAL
ncbi:MAG: hypothetical protein AB1758_11805, partial [Candidatus Eremiobacterota bacterium]